MRTGTFRDAVCVFRSPRSPDSLRCRAVPENAGRAGWRRPFGAGAADGGGPGAVPAMRETSAPLGERISRPVTGSASSRSARRFRATCCPRPSRARHRGPQVGLDRVSRDAIWRARRASTLPANAWALTDPPRCWRRCSRWRPGSRSSRQAAGGSVVGCREGPRGSGGITVSSVAVATPAEALLAIDPPGQREQQRDLAGRPGASRGDVLAFAFDGGVARIHFAAGSGCAVLRRQDMDPPARRVGWPAAGFAVCGRVVLGNRRAARPFAFCTRVDPP